MGFLRRLLGGDRDGNSSTGDAPGSDGSDSSDEAAGAADPVDIDAEERARELELARFDQDRVDDLVRRQQRYADRSWTPPAQGGERRSDDGEKTAG
jgi:hypothetical protein